MKTIKKLICHFLGHQRMVPVTDDFPKMFPAEILQYKSSRNHFFHNGAKIIKHQHYQILAIPYGVKVYICDRCKSLYWSNNSKDAYLCDLSKIPGLMEFNHLYNRFLWEKHERSINYVADKLYTQYLMALKLGVSMESDYSKNH